MYEYLPWSKKELSKSLQDYRRGNFSILDIELGGDCNFHCQYCDSPDRKKAFRVDFSKIDEVLHEGEIRWIYVCGLGEPTFGKNQAVLEELLSLAEKYHVRCSIFTNIFNFSDKLLEYVDKEILYLLFKMDSMDIERLTDLYGVKHMSQQIEKVQEIARHVIIRGGCTNLAASIVPTKRNYDEICQVVEWCIDKKIYPLVAELEYAGAGTHSFGQLKLDREELSSIKWQIIENCCEDLKVPICPAMISGIHINHNGIITADEETGFSCHWFWLKDPKVKLLADFNKTGTWKEYSNLVRTYREGQIETVRSYLDKKGDELYVFGGCGGSIKELLLGHLALHRTKKEGRT